MPSAASTLGKPTRWRTAGCFPAWRMVSRPCSASEIAGRAAIRAIGRGLRRQLEVGLTGVESEQADRLWVAYEPVWAIGEGGTVADPAFANEMHAVLREILGRRFPDREAGVPLLYGGSVNLENAVDLMRQPEIDGLFVGRAAWDAARLNQHRARSPRYPALSSGLIEIFIAFPAIINSALLRSARAASRPRA